MQDVKVSVNDMSREVFGAELDALIEKGYDVVLMSVSFAVSSKNEMNSSSVKGVATFFIEADRMDWDFLHSNLELMVPKLAISLRENGTIAQSLSIEPYDNFVSRETAKKCYMSVVPVITVGGASW